MSNKIAFDALWDESPIDVTPEVNFIWSIANKLRGSYMPDKYGDVIIPMTILRRLECALEPTKEAVLAKYAENPNYPPKVLCHISDCSFYNTSPYSLKELCNEPDNIAPNFKVYLQGFSAEAQEIFNGLEMKSHIDKMDKDGCLFSVVQAFADLDLDPETYDSIKMGYIFEHLIGKFYQNVDAGQFYTGRDIIKCLIAVLMSEGCDDIFDDGKVITVCDQACGTGGMLSTAYSFIKHYNPSADVRLFGQELMPQSYAVGLAEMMIKKQRIENFRNADTFKEDCFPNIKMRFVLENPPFGTPWAGKDAKAGQEDAVRNEFKRGKESRWGAGLPSGGDSQLIFMQSAIDKMDDKVGRAAIIENGSPLFTGGTASGESQIRRWILDKDLLEAIIALPTDLFYNTGIATYVWILSKNKRPERRGYVQLIDATSIFHKLRKPAGSKRNELWPEDRSKIVKLYTAFEKNEYCKIFKKEEFMYREYTVMQPLQRSYAITEERIQQMLADGILNSVYDPAKVDELEEQGSQISVKDMIAVKNTLGQNEGSEEADAQDAIENEIQRHGKAPNVSVFAFTATPKPMTLRLFGRESIDADGNPVYQPFHLYSMKQAIEEGYILDVLQNYIEYKTYYKLNKTIEDDPEMKTIAAKRQIARYIDLFDDNINQRVNIIVEHFRSTVMQELGGQAKAMVVTASREAAVKYRQAFEDYVTRHNYKDVKALVAFSGKVKLDGDNTEYTEPSMNGFAEDKLPKEFDKAEYNVLLVANKYQVGFDQPKLCAMYVLKKLRGVNAVQTLSRLNRVCPPFDKKVVVMDFVNHAEEMEAAFAPFYTTTVLSNTATIAQLRELENKIDGYNVLDDRDVDTVASIVYNPKGKRTTAKEDRLVYQCIQRAVNVLKNQFNEDHQRAFTKNCRGFVRLYEFLSMASSFGDPELHKKYVFVNLLLTYLVVGNSGGISLKDKIQATNFVQESQGDKGNKQRHASAPNVKLSGADVGLTVDEVKHLSEIIDEVNSRAGKGYDSSAMTKVMLQIKDLLLHSDKLKTAAKNNTEQDFEFSFYDNTDDALIEGLSQNQDFFSLLLSNDDIKHRVLGVFLHEVYKELREQQ